MQEIDLAPFEGPSGLRRSLLSIGLHSRDVAGEDDIVFGVLADIAREGCGREPGEGQCQGVDTHAAGSLRSSVRGRGKDWNGDKRGYLKVLSLLLSLRLGEGVEASHQLSASLPLPSRESLDGLLTFAWPER